MGKKSLTKSTTKKKSSPPKKSASKQAATSAMPPKTTEKTVKAQKSPASPPKPVKKTLTVSELLRLSFGTWEPESPYAPPADATAIATYTAPPFFDTKTPEETRAIKALLARQFDLTAPLEPSAPSAPPVEESLQPQETPSVDETLPMEEAPPAVMLVPEPTTPAEPEPAPELPAAEDAVTALEIEFAVASEPEPLPEPEAASGAPPTEDTAVGAPETAPAPPAEPEVTPNPADAAPVPPPEPEKSPESVTAVEKTAAPIPETPAAPEPYIPAGHVCAQPPDKKEPPNNALRMLIGCLAFIFGTLLIASVLNSNNYYLKPTPAGLEIWHGKFSPTGKTLVETVPNVALSAPLESVYNRDQAMTVVYDYCMNQAAEWSTVIREPDFAVIAGLYEQAKKYAPTPAQTDIADIRLRSITAQSLISKADKAIVKRTSRNIDKALAFLHKAAGLATDRTQKQLIRVKIDELTAIKTKKAVKEAGAKPAIREETPALDKKAE